jgi:HK97 gp10 family phage protein
MAQSMAPVKTGALRNSVSIQQSSALSATIGPNVGYGAYQEFGTASRGEFGGSAYTIRPKNPNGWLVFTIDGKKIVTKKVTHPGVRPHPYMRPAFERVITPFGQSLAELAGSYVKYGPNAPTSLQGSAA